MLNKQPPPQGVAMSHTSNESEFRNQAMLAGLKEAMTRVKYAKTEMCMQEPMSDNPAMLLVAYRADAENEPKMTVGDSSSYKMGLIPLIHADDVRECLVDVIGSLPAEKLEFMILCVEGYHDTDPNNTGKQYDRGDMEKDFRTNPFTTVKEGLVVSGVDWEGEYAVNGHCTYSYDDNGVPAFDSDDNWGEIQISEDTGFLTYVMASACRFLEKRILTEKFHQLLTEAPLDKNDKVLKLMTETPVDEKKKSKE